MTTSPSSIRDTWRPYLRGWFGDWIIQIVHALIQLLARGRLPGVFRRVIATIRNLFRRMADSLLHERIPAEAVDPVRLAAIQIRFENSS